jgi:hypothetical protein
MSKKNEDFEDKISAKLDLQLNGLATLQDKIGQMKLIGLPVWRAEFNRAVNNSSDVPETNFSIHSPTKSRCVQMWWVPANGLLCLQDGKHFMVPSETVKFCKFD